MNGVPSEIRHTSFGDFVARRRLCLLALQVLDDYLVASLRGTATESTLCQRLLGLIRRDDTPVALVLQDRWDTGFKGCW